MIRDILFVDDDQILRTAIEQRLRAHADRFGLVTASDGFEAVRTLKERPVSLVVVDLVMPRMDGMSLIAHLGQHYPDLPVIVISGIGDQETREVARTCAAVGHLNKPFQADELIAMIQRALDREAGGGIMNDVSPPVFMQLMEMDARTCTIRILDNHSGSGGILFFREGALVDARAGERRGLDAAHQIFSWDRATIFIRNDCEVVDNRINANLGTIIMTAAGMKDEREERPQDYGESEAIAALSDEAGAGGRQAREPGEDGDDASLEALRQKLANIPGIHSISGDLGQEKAVARLHCLGRDAGFGALVMASLDEGRENARLIVPTRPAGVIRADAAAAAAIRKSLKG